MNKAQHAARQYYDFSTVFENTKTFIDTYNSRQGELTKKLNASHRATAELMVRLYLKQINLAAVLSEDGGPDSFPGFRTYNESLAKCKGCTKRTVMNHRTRLIEAGFITKEAHHGAGGVELWINPEILGKAETATRMEDGTDRIGSPSLFTGREKNLPPLVHEQQEHKNNNSTVDKFISPARAAQSGAPCGHSPRVPEPPAQPTPLGGPAGTGQEQNKNKKNKNTEENAYPASNRQGTVSEKGPGPKQEQKNGDDEAGGVFLLDLIRRFWAYAKNVLYPGLVISGPEEKEVLNLIWESVYEKLQAEGTEAQWGRYQEVLYQRVNMVARWLKRSPEHWIPQPHIYFHPHNERNGFDKTKQWYLKQETLKQEVRNQLLLQQAQAEWGQHASQKGRHKHKTRLELFQMQQKRLAKYNDQTLLQAYQASLQQNLKLQRLKTSRENV